jgi:hypothetical protein
LSGQSLAEFYVFNDGNPVNNANILVNGDTIHVTSSENGIYLWPTATNIGDSAYYSVNSPFGSVQGVVVIPDTVAIIRPARNDTLDTSSAHMSVWHANFFADGYYAHLSRQVLDAAGVFESAYDTTLEIPGLNLLDFGIDTLWVETLRGPYVSELAPNEMLLPRGVVGAAGNYCEIFFTLD